MPQIEPRTIPTTEEVREFIGRAEVRYEPWDAPTPEDVASEQRKLDGFDRWLAAHDAEIIGRLFTANEIRGMVEDNTDRRGNVYRVDFLARLEHEATLRGSRETFIDRLLAAAWEQGAQHMLDEQLSPSDEAANPYRRTSSGARPGGES